MAKSTKEENQSVESKIAELDKKYGKTSLKNLKVFSSGSFTLDIATKIGGFPLGKVMEIFGPESSGKTTITLEAISSFQNLIPDKKVAYIDFEYSFDAGYASNLGIDVENLIIFQPDYQEEGYNYIIDLIEKDLCSLIIIDSHTAATPRKVIEGEMGDVTMGLQARLNSKFLGKIKGLLAKKEVLLIGISQLRSNIGGMGDTNVPTGGAAWKFYSDIRLKIWKSNDKDKEQNATTVDVIKNKCGNPFGKAEFNIKWGEGIDNNQEILDLAILAGIVKRAGSWYSYGEMKLGQGADAVKELFDSNPELFEEIKLKTLHGEQ